MKKILTLTIFLTLFGASLVYANSRTYHISVTIPAIVGVNVADPNQANQEELVELNTELEKQVAQVVRNNEEVLVETIVAK